MSRTRYGFWVRGGKHAPREPVLAARAFAGFAACDEAARPDGEHYLSAFTFGADFRDHLRATASTRGFEGQCGGDWLWFDIDRASDIDAALADARVLCLHLTDHWKVRDDEMLIFISGGKGFHIGVPTLLWSPEPSVSFNRVARQVAETIAKRAGGTGVVIDTGIYDKVRLFRAPNSRHPTTGLRKRIFTTEEFLNIGIERLVLMAKSPLAFDVPQPTVTNELLVAVWQSACAEVAAHDEALKQRQPTPGRGAGALHLNQLTMEFIRAGAEPGGDGAPPEAGRHNRLYSAARNLAEFDCPSPLAHALLTETALDCGIKPSEIRRTIDNALKDAVGKEPPHG